MSNTAFKVKFIGAPCENLTHDRIYSADFFSINNDEYFFTDDCGDTHICTGLWMRTNFVPVLTGGQPIDQACDLSVNRLLDAIEEEGRITDSDKPALAAMDITTKQYCVTDGCGKFIDRNRQSLNLDTCFSCGQTELKRESMNAKLVRKGLDLERAGRIVYSRLTAHLREIK